MVKKLEVKINETKDLAADSFSETSATCAIIARMKSSVKVARHTMGCGKESAVGQLVGADHSRSRLVKDARRG
jgi:hypothetical protein